MVHVNRVTDQERIADRLLRSTAARSYDPELDVNWAAPPEPDKVFLSEHRSSLYGTSLYERLSPQQRRELGKHEAASVAGTGIWLEFVLLRLLAKLAYQSDPASRHVQYALAEMAEECRHSTMFARLIEWMGTPCLPATPAGPAAREDAAHRRLWPGHVGRDPDRRGTHRPLPARDGDR